ncbi:MAG: agmatine deiminase family protein [Flavobacteriaceae bacterium]|nr:agmatine deiminase family protein [Flavobacteriaceae bacterium]
MLKKHGIKYDFLKTTKDIWCRDYMPIQIEKGKFVQFRYEPSYLKDDLELQSDPKEVCKANNIEPQSSKINLDGGNVVNWSDRAIITDRVFDENPNYSNRNKLISEIEKLLEVEIIVIPQIKSDMTGHADGLVRFADRNTLIGNDREQEYKYWKSGINKVLKEKGLDYFDIPFLEHKEKKYPDHAIGCYVNYLEVQDLIILPIFEIENNKDKELQDTFRQIFSDRKIETINFNAVGLFGGLLNCTTWTIKD